MPEKKIVLYADGGEITITDLLPYRTDIQAEGRGKSFDQLIFLNTSQQKVLQSFSGCMVDSNGMQVANSAYVTANIRLLAMRRDKPPVES